MKPVFLLFFIIFFQQLTAQNNISAKVMVVKDSSGQIYPQEIWQALYMKGYYDLKPENPKEKDSPYLLVRLSEKEYLKKMEMIPKPRPSNVFVDGKKHELFKANDLDGKILNLPDSSGKIIVLNFWFINCGPCRREIPDLNNLVDSFDKGKVEFVAIALDQAQDIKNFFKQLSFKYRQIPNGRSIAAHYGVTGYPTHAIIDQEGKVYFHSVGLAVNTIYWLQKSIKELLEKKEVGRH